MKRPAIILRILLGALLILPVLSVVLVWVRRDEIVASHQVALPVLGEIGDFSLIDSAGKTVTPANLRDKIWVAGFILTRCSGSCPIITHSMSQLQTQLPVRDDFRMVSVSVDPGIDTPAALTKYIADNKLNSTNWFFLTGPKKEIYTWIRSSFKLGVDDSSGTPDEPVNHSTKLVLIDRRGQVRGYYDGTDAESIKKLAREVNHLVALRS